MSELANTTLAGFLAVLTFCFSSFMAAVHKSVVISSELVFMAVTETLLLKIEMNFSSAFLRFLTKSTAILFR